MAFGMLFWALRLGYGQSSWLPGILLAVGALAVVALMVVGGILRFTNIHWQ